MLDLARVAALHEAALAAGLSGVLPDGYEILAPEYNSGKAWRLWKDGRTKYASQIAVGADQAAVAWWLREWCYTHDRLMLSPPKFIEIPKTDAAYHLAWAEEIVANRKATP